MFEWIKKAWGSSVQRSSGVSDLYPDLPRLPSLPCVEMSDRLQDTLGEALRLVAIGSRISPERIETRLSLLWSKSRAETQAEIALVFEGSVTITPELISDFSRVLRQPEEAVYRCALFLKQREGCSEIELLDEVMRGAEQRLKERGESA